MAAKNCTNGCKFNKGGKKGNYCRAKKAIIKNRGCYCKLYEPETKWDKFLNWLGL